jgi:uncharacterized protein YcbK (DUF882 family)
VTRTAFIAVFLLAGTAHAVSSERHVKVGDPSMGRASSSSASMSTPTSTSRPSSSSSSNRAGKGAAKNPAVDLFHVNHKERMQIRLRDASGRPVRGQQKRFDRFLRCHYTNIQHSMNPRLISLIYKTGRHWPGHRVEVVSGYRHPKFAKNPRSPHMKGQACDFRVVGVTNGELRDYLRRTFDKVGVGYYPNSSFVHLDIRKDHSAFWIDYSGPGERALYSSAPGDDLRSGRADRFHPSKIDSSWIEGSTAQAAQASPGAQEIGDSPAAAAPSERPSVSP